MSYIYTMEYYSAIKKNKFESVPVRWMNLKPVIQSEVRKRKTNNHILTHIYMELENWYVLITSVQGGMETQIQRKDLWTQWGKERVG